MQGAGDGGSGRRGKRLTLFWHKLGPQVESLLCGLKTGFCQTQEAGFALQPPLPVVASFLAWRGQHQSHRPFPRAVKSSLFQFPTMVPLPQCKILMGTATGLGAGLRTGLGGPWDGAGCIHPRGPADELGDTPPPPASLVGSGGSS